MRRVAVLQTCISWLTEPLACRIYCLAVSVSGGDIEICFSGEQV